MVHPTRRPLFFNMSRKNEYLKMNCRDFLGHSNPYLIPSPFRPYSSFLPFFSPLLPPTRFSFFCFSLYFPFVSGSTSLVPPTSSPHSLHPVSISLVSSWFLTQFASKVHGKTPLKLLSQFYFGFST